jgi:hypothetical protein
VPLRSDCTLVFRQTPAPDGDRQRVPLIAAGDPALLEALGREPLGFSSSALLRPIVQDSLFPTAAYVGGPAEVSYFVQTAALYELFGLPVPLVAPRARFRLVDARTRRLLDRLRLTAGDCELARAPLLARLEERCWADPGREPPLRLRARLGEPLDAELARLVEPWAALAPALGRAIARTRGTVARALERLTARMSRTAAQRQGDLLGALERACARLAPGGHPQERVFAFASFAAEVGPRALVARILGAIDPFDPEVRELALDGDGMGGAA